MGSLDEYCQRVQHGPPMKPLEEMKLEVMRLASFVDWPYWAHKRPGNLAENGFYYSGEGDRVICFSCKIEISNWEKSSRVREKHQSMSPHCGFLSGRNTGNVSLNTVSSEKDPHLHCDSPTETSCNDSGFHERSASFSPTDSFSKSGSRHNNIHDADELFKELQSLNSTSETSSATNNLPVSLDQKHHLLNSESGTGEINEVDLQFVKYESYRNRTFEGKWSGDSFVSPAELAKAGFYFISEPDRVQCAFCKGRLLNWKPSDVPMVEHKRHFPDCPYVLERNVGNVPIDETQSSVQVPKHMKEKKKDQTPSERLGIMMDKPKNPEYAIESLRVDSFKTWPKKTTISPTKLANAGFFYVGYSDNVKCFFCDGGLRNWDPADDPWREHARWFSRCGFLKLKMGEDYVNQILAETNATGNSKTTQQTFGGSSLPKMKTPPPLDPRELNARLDTPMVRTVIDMGFEVDMVKSVLGARLKTEGDDFINAEQLLQALFEHQETLDKEKNRSPSPGEPGTATSQAKPGISRRKKKNRNKRKKKSGSKGDLEGTGQECEKDSDSGSEEIVEPPPPEPHIQEDEEVQALVRQYQRIKEERTCKICMDEECTIVFLPCGHLVCCADCAPALRNCPICRTLIKGSVRIYTT